MYWHLSSISWSIDAQYLIKNSLDLMRNIEKHWKRSLGQLRMIVIWAWYNDDNDLLWLSTNVPMLIVTLSPELVISSGQQRFTYHADIKFSMFLSAIHSIIATEEVCYRYEAIRRVGSLCVQRWDGYEAVYESRQRRRGRGRKQQQHKAAIIGI